MQGKVMPENSAQIQLYAGIDVCKDRLNVYLHPIGERLQVGNDRQGCSRLKRHLAGRAVALVVMEATAKYHRLAYRALAAAGLGVAVVNPLRARLFAEAAGTLAKTDRVDARMLAILGQALGPQAVPPAPEAVEALAELVRARRAATAEKTAIENRRAASQTAFLRAELARKIKSHESHIARLAAEIKRRIAADPALARRHAILLSIPGIGPCAAAAMLAETPELGALSGKAAASLAGLAPIACDSGQTVGLRRIRGGRAGVRAPLYMAALTAARHHPDLARFHRRLIAAGKKPKIVLTAIMRKLIVLANTLLKENRLWRPMPA
jgi:transposase